MITNRTQNAGNRVKCVLLSREPTFDATALMAWLIGSLILKFIGATLNGIVTLYFGVPSRPNIDISVSMNLFINGGLIAPALETCALIWLVWVARDVTTRGAASACVIGILVGLAHWHSGLSVLPSTCVSIWFALAAHLTNVRLNHASNATVWWEQFSLHSLTNLA